MTPDGERRMRGVAQDRDSQERDHQDADDEVDDGEAFPGTIPNMSKACSENVDGEQMIGKLAYAAGRFASLRYCAWRIR
jgi:hypothetical protein